MFFVFNELNHYANRFTEIGNNMGSGRRCFELGSAVRPATGGGGPLSHLGVHKRKRAPITLPVVKFMRGDSSSTLTGPGNGMARRPNVSGR
jgi:hypothetical protein